MYYPSMLFPLETINTVNKKPMKQKKKRRRGRGRKKERKIRIVFK